MDISTGEGAEKGRERGGTEASVMVGDKASGRQRGEREESRVSRARKGWGRDCEEPKIRGEGFRSGKERVG